MEVNTPLIKQPLRLSEFLDQSFSIYKRFILQGFCIGALSLGLPSFILGQVLLTHKNSLTSLTGIILVLALVIFMGICSITGFIVISKAVSQLCLGESVNWKEAFDYSRKNFWKVTWASMMFFLWYTFCSFLFLIPGFIAILNNSLVVTVMIMEKRPLKECWKRSKNLVQNNRWRIIAIFTILTLAKISLSICFYLLIYLFESSNPLLSITNNIILNVAVEGLLFSLYPILFTLLYYEIRVRKEALDLDLQFNALEVAPAL